MTYNVFGGTLNLNQSIHLACSIRPRVILYCECVINWHIMRCMSDMLPAAIAAGARMDMTYHPGVWRSVKYTCCDVINKRAPGCTHTTQDVAAVETPVSVSETVAIGRKSLELPPRSTRPVSAPKKRKNVCLAASVSWVI